MKRAPVRSAPRQYRPSASAVGEQITDAPQIGAMRLGRATLGEDYASGLACRINWRRQAKMAAVFSSSPRSDSVI